MVPPKPFVFQPRYFKWSERHVKTVPRSPVSHANFLAWLVEYVKDDTVLNVT